MTWKEAGDSTWNRWKPVRPRYMERFKDRAWRLFGIKVPLELRDEIRTRHAFRKDEWNRRRTGGLIAKTIMAHKDLFIESITKDFVLFDLLKKDSEPLPQVFSFKRDPPPHDRQGYFDREAAFSNASNAMIIDREIFKPRVRNIFSSIDDKCVVDDHLLDSLRYTMATVQERFVQRRPLPWWRRAWNWIRGICGIR